MQLAWPIIGLNVLQVLAIAIDTAMVGRTPGAESSLTGLSYAAQLIFLLMVTMIGLSVGVVALISRAKGAGSNERVQHILHQSLQLTFLLGLVAAIVGNLFASPLLLALGASPETIAPALVYLRLILLGAPFIYTNILFASALRAVGNTRLPFLVALVMNGLNVLFNYGLILGHFGLPQLGIRGAAIGTVAAEACAVALMFLMLRLHESPELRPKTRFAAIDLPLTRKLFRIGWPAAADLLVFNIGFLVIVGMLGRIDQTYVAAHGIGLRVQSLAFVPGLGVSQAIGALVGQALGRGDEMEARRTLRAGMVMSITIMTVLGLGLILQAGAVVSLFGVDPGSHLHKYSIEWIQILGAAMPLAGMYVAFTGILRGSGATMTSLRVNFVVTFLALIPTSYLLGFTFHWGALGIWLAFPLTFIIKVVWLSAEYRRGKWVNAA